MMVDGGVRLDPAEVEVLQMIATGATAASVARALDTSERTVRRRMRSACEQFGVETPIEAVVQAVREGLL